MTRLDQQTFEALRTQIEQLSAHHGDRLRFANEFAVQAQKGHLLANGGAIVAMFTLIGQGADSSFVKGLDQNMIWWAFGFFAAGLVLCLVSMIIAFEAQQFVALWLEQFIQYHVEALHGRSSQPLEPGGAGAANALTIWATLAALLSLAGFIVGAAIALASALHAA